MKLEAVVTLANAAVRLRFVAMERSLRATGWEGPLLVIPYDERRFALPAGAEWWEDPDVNGWLAAHGGHPMMRKYACLRRGGYQFVDADVVFLDNPARTLADVGGFVTSCGHWHNPDQAVTDALRTQLAARTTVWQSAVFNAGQFAAEIPLFPNFDDLRRVAEAEPGTCLGFPGNDQTGLNLLVARSGVVVTNLTLPPSHMESTWAGDYPGEDYAERYWPDPARRPYLLHWAGTPMDDGRHIHREFTRWLTEAERVEWDAHAAAIGRAHRALARSPRALARRVRQAAQVLLER